MISGVKRRFAVQGRVALLGMLCVLSAALMGCATKMPTAVNPAAVSGPWQSSPPISPHGPWRAAQPGDGQDKGAWWTLFGDEPLNALQAQAERANPSLLIAASRWRQARDLLDVTGAASIPRVDASLRSARTRTSGNRPSASAGAQATSTMQNDVALLSTVSYEFDLFGRVRHDQQAAQAGAQQAQAELLNARLVLAADLASCYFNLRSLDAEIDVLKQGLSAQTRAVQLLVTRRDGGVASSLDVAQQQAQLDATRTQLTLLFKQRQQLEHALATLTGTPANEFTVAVAPLPESVPSVPVGLPADVLQRRPDMAASEHAVAVARAQLGLAEVAWFPSLVLSANGGWEARDLARLVSAPSLAWALGGSAVQTVFDGGRLRAREDQAQAGLELAGSAYRLTVLRALQEVEDGLTALSALDLAQAQARAAVQSAQRVLDLAQDRYTGGLSTYLDVVTAQQNVLNNQRLSSQLRGQQLQATTYLIKALGGSWHPVTLAGNNAFQP